MSVRAALRYSVFSETSHGDADSDADRCGQHPDEGSVKPDPIEPPSILVSPEVVEFSSNMNDRVLVERELRIAGLTDEAIWLMDFDAAAQALVDSAVMAGRDNDPGQASEFKARFYRSDI